MKSYSFFEGGGQMGALIRTLNWSATPLGDPATWPLSLQLHTRTMLNNKVGMYIAWGENYIQLYNDAYRPILGESKHPAAMGISTKETFSEIWDIIGSMFQDVMNGKAVGFPDFMLPLNRNGFIEQCYFDFSYSPIFHENGSVGGVLVTVIETTEKVNSLKKLNINESNLRNLVMTAPVAMCVLKEPNYIVEIANEPMMELWGTTSDVVMHRPIFEGLPEARDQGLEQLLDGVYKTGIPFSGKEHAIKLPRNGELKIVYINFTYEPFRDNNGEIHGIIAVAIDVSELVESRRKVEESEANLKRLILKSPVAMTVFRGPDYIVDIANQPMLELVGKSMEQFVNKPFFEGLPEIKEQGLENILSNVYKTATTYRSMETIFDLPRNGIHERRYVNFIYEPLNDAGGNIEGIIVVALDVTEQVEARRKIEEAEERARLAIDSANIGTFDLDLKNGELITSDRFNKIYGSNAPLTHKQFIELYHLDDQKLREVAHEVALKDGYLSYQSRISLTDNVTRWVKVDGKVYYDEINKPIRLLGTVLDITPNVELQRQKDDFLAIASHELKTPLTSVKGYTQILTALVKKGDQITSLNILKKTERQIVKMTKLIHNFLDISKLESAQLQLQKEPFDLNEVVSETINYYNLPENKERLRFNKGDIPELIADKSKIGHVIDNFISNALKYSPLEKTVLITTSFQNNQITVSVKDNGKGINDSSREKIFQRFYRADNVRNDTASGFGIGLYFSAEIIRLHNGKIWFDTKEGEGSTFYFSLNV